MAKILIGVPTYLSQMHSAVAHVMVRCSKENEIDFAQVDSSACAMTMNRLWVQALEMKDKGQITHFLMWHSDIVPEFWFIDKMVKIMEREGADVLSAIVPIKDADGFTSTALDEQMADVDPYWRVRRLTMHEVYQNYPPTFTDPKLLLNTGLMLVDMRKPWVDSDSVYFTLEDRIIRWRGQRVPAMMPEDWGFSRMVKKVGAKLYATREIALTHYGVAGFPNMYAWGAKKTDYVPPPPSLETLNAVDAAQRVDGYMSLDELRWLAERAQESKVIVEIGSWKGRSTKALAMATAGTVYAVDNWKGTRGGDATGVEADAKGREAIFGEFLQNLQSEIESGKVVVVNVDHENAMEKLAFLKDKTDMVFIDGAHDEASVRRDIENFSALLKTGGVLCGHDFCGDHPGVCAAVSALCPAAQPQPDTSIWACRIAEAAKVA